MIYKGSCRFGDFFKSRRENGRSKLSLLSVTMNNGLIDREDLDRKQDTSLAPEDHLLVKSGDIVYNMMRMWQGASGLAEKDGLVSPAYVVLRPTAKIDSRYASYLFKSKRMIYLFWAYSHGITSDRLRLYYDDFARIPVTVPPLHEQKEIAKVLSTWDKAIIANQALIENARLRRDLLFQRLILGEQRLPSFDKAWRKQHLGGLFQSLDAGVSVNSSDQKLDESCPSILKTSCVSSGTFRPLERKNVIDKQEVSRLREPLKNHSLLISRMNTPELVGMCAYVEIAPSGTYLPDRLWQATVKGSVDIRWLSYLLSSRAVKKKLLGAASGTSGSMKNLSKSSLQAIRVSVPGHEEQVAIADVLALCDKELEKAALNVDGLIRERKALMQHLLGGRRSTRLPKRTATARA